MRVFAALAVPDAVADHVDGSVAPLRGRHQELRWSRPDGWHVTLAFLGEVEEDQVPRVVTAVERGVRVSDAGTIGLVLGRPGHFNRRVLWLSVDDEPGGTVARLGGAVQRAVVAADLPCDEKPVHPHLTLARTRGRARLPRSIVDDVPAIEAAWTVDRVLILRSHLGTGGSRYEELGAVLLG